MNAAVRAVVRTAIVNGLEPYAIYEGYQGLINGGNYIKPLQWGDVSGILHQGGTIIGTARSAAFRTREGRRIAAKHLVQHGIDGLVIIGGDGSLSGANLLQKEWQELLAELVAENAITQETLEQYPHLPTAGIIGSIDNDMYGTDMTIGADTALHRIVEAVDAISSTAASHQRSFVVEVMGRNCGYLALMSALATGADWVLIPESPPNLDNWEDKMCDVLRQGRLIGRRDSIVIVAEGARDRHGNPISSTYVRQVLEEKLGEDARITILGHVQRGGAPTAFDRNLSTQLGTAAVEQLIKNGFGDKTIVMGMRGNKIVTSYLSDCLFQTHSVAEAIAQKDFVTALSLRGNSFQAAFNTVRTLVRAKPHQPKPDQRRLRLAVLHGSAPAPGMNTAMRAAVRLGIDQGHTMLGVHNGFEGLIRGEIEELNWMSVNGWSLLGGAELGTNRKVPCGSDFYAIARNLEENKIEGILMVGGWAGYEAILALYGQRENFPVFKLPMVCLPASIDNDLPGSELSVGADTALNNIVEAVDKLKQSAVASRRAFVVEVMGRHCGYLALMSALATGAERVYLPEEGVTLKELADDVQQLIRGFRQGKRVGIMIRNEVANSIYTTQFMQALFEEEGGDEFNVRTAILGHIQQGGKPSPFDRIQAARLAQKSIEFLIAQAQNDMPSSACIGLWQGETTFTPLEDAPRMMDMAYQRPKSQWWLNIRPIARMLAQPAPPN
jgi:6-phosphofructokinase 1